jgi:PIN domain nuclease of toxin-antitoxin system
MTAPENDGFLLDTHVLLWLLKDPGQIREEALRQLRDRNSALLVSSVSPWEIAIKTKNGRYDGRELLSAWPAMLSMLGADELPISSADAIAAGGLEWQHRDPFDRMLVAQSQNYGLVLATRDGTIADSFPTTTLVV